MRRSKAPSALNKAKRLRNLDNPEEEENFSDKDEQYTWGSRNTVKINQNKRIFNVVWRDVSVKKHKTWKGDGTLEVNNSCLKAILKDESGKYLGSTTKININGFVSDFQMIVAGKEIEIQSEITEEEDLHKLRRSQMENRNWFNEEWMSAKDKSEEEKKHKGSFIFTPNLILNTPKVNELNYGKERGSNSNSTQKPQNQISHFQGYDAENKPNLVPISKTDFFKELVLFLRPSDLQQFLFQKTLEYFSIKSNYPSDNIQTLDIVQVLKLICDHPSLINQKTNKLIDYLIPAFPDWTEMGPFDSAKLEFVQHFLGYLNRSNTKTCTILAKNTNVLNMLQGLCDFMNIKCLRLSTNNSINTEAKVVEFCSTEGGLTQVLLLDSVEMISGFNIFTHCKKFIFFEEYLENANVCALESFKDITIYYLVTAYSVEELLLLDEYNDGDFGSLLRDLKNITNKENDCCYLHSKIGCNCFMSTDGTINHQHTFIKNWKHFKSPFDMKVLKMSSLENSSENIVSIFCKKKNLISIHNALV